MVSSSSGNNEGGDGGSGIVRYRILIRTGGGDSSNFKSMEIGTSWRQSVLY